MKHDHPTTDTTPDPLETYTPSRCAPATTAGPRLASAASCARSPTPAASPKPRTPPASPRAPPIACATTRMAGRSPPPGIRRFSSPPRD